MKRQNQMGEEINLSELLKQAEKEVTVGAEDDSLNRPRCFKISSKEFVHKADAGSISSGLKYLDKAIGGFSRGCLYAFCGRPAMGKSTMAISLITNIAINKDIPVGLFSLEMTSPMIIQRIINNKLNISSKFGRNENRKISNIKQIEEAPIFIDDSTGLDVHEFCKRAVRLVRREGVKIIIVDYLQLMRVENMHFESRSHEISYEVRTLKHIAKYLDIPIIVMSQLFRSSEIKPILSDLKDYAAIMEHADVVSFLHRPEYYHIFVDNKGNDLRNKMEIIVEKNRMGNNTSFYLNFNGKLSQINDIDMKNSEVADIKQSQDENDQIIYP